MPSANADETPPQQFVKLTCDVLSRADLSPADKLIFAVIVDRIGQNGQAWPGLRRLASDCGLSKTTAQEAVRRLEGVGLLAVERAIGNPGGRTNRYRLPERAENRTYQKPDVPETGHRTYQKPDTGRTRNRTEPDPCNQTHVTRPKRSARTTDPWALAQTAMTGDTLRTDAFQAAWLAWVEYRRQAHKPLTPATIEKQIRTLEGFGHETAIASINRSIEHGWQGLFKPDADRAGRGGRGSTAGGRRRVVPELNEHVDVPDYPG